MSRRASRERVFQLVYERVITGEENPMTLALLAGGIEEESEKFFAADIYNGVCQKFDLLYSLVDKYALGYKPDRVYKTDLSIIILAAYEILFTDTPDKVAANEAVELGKRYSSEKSYGYINGVLSAIIKDKEKILNEWQN